MPAWGHKYPFSLAQPQRLNFRDQIWSLALEKLCWVDFEGKSLLYKGLSLLKPPNPWPKALRSQEKIKKKVAFFKSRHRIREMLNALGIWTSYEQSRIG